MLTHLAFFALGFMTALLCAMVMVCCESERIDRKNKNQEKKDE